MAPAAETVSTAEGLFGFEQLQLTDNVIANLSHYQLSDLELFSFPDGSSETEQRRAVKARAGCKTYPGDTAWPSVPIWRLFDVLLGGGLIKTVPEASPCYPEWGTYNPGKCQALTETWSNSSLR